MDPQLVDAVVDLIFGLLLVVGFLGIVWDQSTAGAAFGLGIFVSYVVHVAWKMARFDPEWMSHKPADR